MKQNFFKYFYNISKIIRFFDSHNCAGTGNSADMIRRRSTVCHLSTYIHMAKALAAKFTHLITKIASIYFLRFEVYNIFRGTPSIPKLLFKLC